MNCLNGQCRAPIACGVFGYCRERNFDGQSMSEDNIKRRKAESDAQNDFNIHSDDLDKMYK